MIKYLRNDRKVVPKDLAGEKLASFESEIKHWKVDKGLKQYDQLTYTKLQWKVINLLKSTPRVDELKAQGSLSLQTWKSIKPLSIEDIIQNSKIEVEFNPNEMEFGECSLKDRVETG